MKRIKIRKGIRDTYYHLMLMSWVKLLLLAIVSFMLINTLFTVVMLLADAKVSNLAEDKILDYFFFSVQTLSTIGYGHFSPLNLSANILVTVQAFVGMIFMATITGVTFAKFAKPISKIVFSDDIIITEMDGEKYLCFRVGNKRNNDIVDATVKVTGLFDETTNEGDKIRRMYDLDLLRSHSAFFALSWSIFHPLKNSPFDLDKLLGISVLIIGHDGTYSSTVYARKMYYNNNVVENAVFEDVIYEDELGVTKVDFEKFHNVKRL